MCVLVVLLALLLSACTASSVAVPSTTVAPSSSPASTVVLPDRHRTPGARNPDVTQANIAATICRRGWTATVRPPSSYTSALKRTQLASGYAYNGDRTAADYEEDHLISLELGGSPSAVANLWPEPYKAVTGARAKDKIENKLNDLVCAHQMPLATAQKLIATNWYAAYQTYVL